MKHIKKYNQEEMETLLECLDEESRQYLAGKLLPSRIWLLIYGIGIGLSLGLVLFFALEMIRV